MHELFIDCCRLGPAPTRGREVFVIAATAVLLAAVLIAVQAGLLFAATAGAIVAAYMIGRWAYGERTVWAAR
ncbi:hypothetical protein GCM10023197_26980 [Gordonia humi]